MREESLRQSSLWMITGQGVAMAAQAVYFVLIGRALGSREYGAFVGVAALVAALSQFSTLGMEMILVRNVSRDRASFPRTWGHALLIASAGFLLLLAASMLYARFALRPELRLLAEPGTILCRCEDVAVGAVQGFTRGRDARLHARCGMGRCQGRTCGPAAEFLYGWAPGGPRQPLAPTPCAELVQALALQPLGADQDPGSPGSFRFQPPPRAL